MIVHVAFPPPPSIAEELSYDDPLPHTNLSIFVSRHPVHSKRPSFSKIFSYLKAPNEQLLQWVDEDAASQRARTLGAPLSDAESLYLDLQNVYKDNNH